MITRRTVAVVFLGIAACVTPAAGSEEFAKALAANGDIEAGTYVVMVDRVNATTRRVTIERLDAESRRVTYRALHAFTVDPASGKVLRVDRLQGGSHY